MNTIYYVNDKGQEVQVTVGQGGVVWLDKPVHPNNKETKTKRRMCVAEADAKWYAAGFRRGKL